MAMDPMAMQRMQANALRRGPQGGMGISPPQRPFTPGAGLPPQAQANLPPQAMGGNRPTPPMPPMAPPVTAPVPQQGGQMPMLQPDQSGMQAMLQSRLNQPSALPPLQTQAQAQTQRMAGPRRG